MIARLDNEGGIEGFYMQTDKPDDRRRPMSLKLNHFIWTSRRTSDY